MLDWLKDRRGYFLTQDDGSKFFDKLRVEVHGHFLFNVQSPVASFFGREEELKTLHNLINQGGPTVIHQPTSICGLGGIGKTELVRKYVSEYGKQFYDNILWIDAQSYESMKASFIDLASYVLGVVCKDLNIKSVLRDTYSFFSKRKCLFVFDNAVAFKTVDSIAGISDFLPTSFSPQGINNPKVLITSRNREWGNIPQLELKTFKEQQAFDFIKFELGIEDGSQDTYIKKLAEILQYFPLALQQAVAYIKENNRSINVGSECSIIDYISRYESETKNLLNFNFPKHRSLYVDTTYTIMKITITRIKENKEFGEQGSQIIYIISLLAPENIPVEMFLELDLIQNNKEKLGQTIELLKQYSLINSSQVITQLNVHRLVQQVARIILKRQKKEGNTFREAIALLIQMFKKANDLHKYCLIRQLLTHSESLLSHLDSWLKSHPKNKATVNSYFSKLYPFLSDGYQHLSNFTQQMVIQKRQLALLQTKYGNNNITVTVPLFYLSIAYGALGHPQKKKELLERVLKIEEKHYGRNHFKLAKTLMSLGNAYGSLGNTRKQKDLLEQALKIQERHYGRDNIEVASTLANLSNAHCDLGDVQKHKELIERALKIKENHYGKNHFAIANTLVNLANAYFVLGSPQKQKEILEGALIIQENHYGKNHFEVAITLGSLGNAYGALVDPRKQIKFYKQALDIQEKHYGKNNFEITDSLVNLANAYGVVGDPKNQKELLERALSIQEQHYGEHNFRIVATLLGLGNAYGALGDPKKQKELFERALEIEEKQYGRFNINVAKILCFLSNAYFDLGDPQTQKLLLERALDIQEKHYGRNHFEVGNTLTNLGNAYFLLGHPQKQIELLERALIILEKHYGRNYYKVGITLHNLGMAYGNRGQQREQKEYLERALEIEEKHYGRNNFKLAKTLMSLGNAYGSLGNTRKQKDLLEQALKIQERHYGRDNNVEV